ncbi:hypothetical protein C0993_006279 [Termitomyces sp. T159_Od127]|nr:hypothetical protein C0993_006279 [Termitomyces sp. T159_Od127]
MGKFASIRFRRNVIEETDVESEGHVDGPCTSSTTTTMRARWRHPLAGYVARNSGYIFFACVFLLFMRAGYLAGGSSQEHGVGQERDEPLREHPITLLMDEAEGKYRQKLAGQSRTLKAAVGEYKKRYSRAPPRGFDEWWAFAQEHGALFVDEYDGLVADLAPFWALEGAELRRRVRQVSQLPSIDVVRIKDGIASTLRLSSFEDSDVSARANGFRDMVGNVAHKLPDLDFPINAKAEGRVLVPWEHRMFPNLTHQDSSVGIETMLNGPFRPDWGSDGTVWEAWRRTCAPANAARRLFSSLRNVFASERRNYLSSTSDTPSLHFASTTAASTLNFCTDPHEHYTQGHFFSDWRTLPVLYPIFSPARAQGFMDIRIPSHYYYGSTDKYTYGWDPINLELGEVDKMEVPWAHKENKIFWRGATTGGGSHPPGFAPQYQRHRFIRMASDNSSTPHTITFASPTPGSDIPQYTSATLPLSVLNDAIMDTAFTKAVSPESYPGGLDALTAAHRFGDAVPLGRHWAFKYLMDMDGMGYSGRFMAFLASDSNSKQMENVSSSSHIPSDAQSVRSPVGAVDHATLVKIFSFLDVQPGDDGNILGDPSIRLRPIPRPIVSEPASPAEPSEGPPPPLIPHSFTTHLYRASLVCKAFFSPAMDLLWRSMDSFVPILNLLPTMKKIGDVFMFTEDVEVDHVERFKMYGSRIHKFTLTEEHQLQIAPFALLHIASILPNIPHVLCSSAHALSSSTASLLLTNGLKHFELTNVTDTMVQVIKPFLCTLQARAPELEHLVLRDSLGSETLSVISTYQSLLSLELVGNIDIVLFSQIVTLPELRRLVLNVADSTPVENPRTANLIGLKKLETLHITGSGPTVESFILRLEGSSLADARRLAWLGMRQIFSSADP